MGLTPQQLLQLVQPVAAWRRNMDGKHAHLEAYDVRAHLLRVFGFGGSDIETVGSWLVGSRQYTVPASTTPDGEEVAEWAAITVAYRARVRISVRDLEGAPVGTWSAEAVGSESGIPAFDWPLAHHNAITTAESLATKRAAINLGDQFGLGLYGRNLDKPLVTPALWPQLMGDIDPATFTTAEEGLDPVQRERGETVVPPAEQVWLERMREAIANAAMDSSLESGPGLAYNEARMGKAAPATMERLRDMLEGRA